MKTTVDENMECARRFIEDHWNNFDIAVIDEICTDDFIHHDNKKDNDREAQKQRIPMLRTAFPDMKMDIINIFANGDRVAINWTFNATNLGTFQNLQASVKPVNLSCITIFRCKDGRIAEMWSKWDELDFVQQLGYRLVTPK